MTMKLIKKTDEYTIYQRGDERYAVKDADKKPVNGEEKVKVLLAEGLITLAQPGAPAAAEPETAEGESEAGDEAAADAADDSQAEEPSDAE